MTISAKTTRKMMWGKGFDIDGCIGRFGFLLVIMYNLILVKTIRKIVLWGRYPYWKLIGLFRLESGGKEEYQGVSGRPGPRVDGVLRGNSCEKRYTRRVPMRPKKDWPLVNSHPRCR
jgi:hypothetical protein